MRNFKFCKTHLRAWFPAYDDYAEYKRIGIVDARLKHILDRHEIPGSKHKDGYVVGRFLLMPMIAPVTIKFYAKHLMDYTGPYIPILASFFTPDSSNPYGYKHAGEFYYTFPAFVLEKDWRDYAEWRWLPAVQVRIRVMRNILRHEQLHGGWPKGDNNRTMIPFSTGSIGDVDSMPTTHFWDSP